MNFGEKATEYSQKHGKEVPVWQSPKYLESKAKAEEIINSQKYGVKESDFWILMNATKSGKMAYTGLIISHNGCLKINDCLESKFDPSCVTIDKEGYKGSLVYTYCNSAQGIYEVGEASATNCKNDYPYAMAFKRLFDRVVLKLSRLAYAGIYSDSEADEFAQQIDAPSGQEKAPESKGKTQKKQASDTSCEECGQKIKPAKTRHGTMWSAENIAAYSQRRHGRALCAGCQAQAEEERRAAEEEMRKMAEEEGQINAILNDDAGDRV